MPGEFNDFIPSPRRNPRRFVPKTFEEILEEAVADEEAFFDADDVSFAEEARMAVILGEPVESESPIGVPRPTPAIRASEAVPVQEVQTTSTTLPGRLVNSFGRGARRGFMPDEPLGLSANNVRSFRQAGIFNRDPDNPTPLGTANEALFGAIAAPIELSLRALAAVEEGGISALGQVLQEAGFSRGEAKRAERNARVLLTTLGVAGAAAPVALAGLPTAVRVRRMKPPMFKPLPLSKDMPLTSSVNDFKSEIQHVLETGESSVGLVARSDFGPITIDFGFPGNGPNFDGGFGLSKIIAKRTAVDKIDGERFVRERLPEVLARGKLQLFQGRDKGRRAVIQLGRSRAFLRLFRDDDRETWVLNSFELFEK